MLRSKFSEVSKLLVDTLMQSSKLDGSPTALIRSLLMCLATILQKQVPYFMLSGIIGNRECLVGINIYSALVLLVSKYPQHYK